jgi:hypothetical protein
MPQRAAGFRPLRAPAPVRLEYIEYIHNPVSKRLNRVGGIRLTLLATIQVSKALRFVPSCISNALHP